VNRLSLGALLVGALLFVAAPSAEGSSSSGRWSHDGLRGTGSGAWALVSAGANTTASVDGSWIGRGSWSSWRCSYVKMTIALQDGSTAARHSACSAGKSIKVKLSYRAPTRQFSSMALYACAQINNLPDSCTLIGSPKLVSARR
jgi:hypothetical protein